MRASLIKSFAFVTLILSAGCASATPIDFLIPTKAPSEATTEYLGHLYPDYKSNKLYHSLSDTKFEKAMVPIRKMELQGLYYAAKGELDFIDMVGSKMSGAAWTGISALLLAAGIAVPKPGTQAKIDKAKSEFPT